MKRTVDHFKSIGFTTVRNKKHYRLSTKEMLLKESTDGHWILTIRDSLNYYCDFVFDESGKFEKHMIWSER